VTVMKDEAYILKTLENLLDKKRLEHSIGVSNTSQQLAARFGAHPHKAKIAGLVHDCAKGLTRQQMIDAIKRYNLRLDTVTIMEQELIHGPLGAAMAADIFEIDDLDILNAIRYHTTGRANMTILEKIVYLSDFIEPSRCYPGVDRLRDLAFKDLDDAIIKAFSNTIDYVLRLGSLIHPLTIDARNDMLIRRKYNL